MMLDSSASSRLVSAATTLAILLCAIVLVILSAEAQESRRARARPSSAQTANNRSCERTTLDACATTLFVFGRRDVYLPQNSAEMVPHCQEEFEAEDCIKSYARKCLAPFERQVAGMLILGAGQVLRKRCSEEGTREYLSHYKCIKQTLGQMHDAMDQLIYTLMAAAGASSGAGQPASGSRVGATSAAAAAAAAADDDLKIPISCCAFARFQETAQKIVRLACGPYDAKAEQYIGTKMIKGYVGDVLDLSCQGYELASDKCARLKMPAGGFEWNSTGVLVRQANATLPAGPKPNSVVLPFLDIFTNL